jgi:DNA-binding XRE family transcriptional regulator
VNSITDADNPDDIKQANQEERDNIGLNLARKIKAARTSFTPEDTTKATQEWLAKKLAVSRPAVAQWENTNPKMRTTPSLEQLGVISKVLAVPLSWLYEDNWSVTDVRHARNLFLAGKWETYSGVSTDELLPTNPDVPPLPATVAVTFVDEWGLYIHPDGESRVFRPAREKLLDQFFSSVKGALTEKNGTLWELFEQSVPWGKTAVHVDFMADKAIVEFTEADNLELKPPRQLEKWRNPLSRLLLLSALLKDRKDLRKYLAVFVSADPGESWNELETYMSEIGVTLMWFKDRNKMASFLESLADGTPDKQQPLNFPVRQARAA